VLTIARVVVRWTSEIAARSTDTSAGWSGRFLSLSLASARCAQARMASTLASEGGGGLKGFDTVAGLDAGWADRPWTVEEGEDDHDVCTSEVSVWSDPLTTRMASLLASESERRSSAEVGPGLALEAAGRAREGGGAVELAIGGLRPSRLASWPARSALASDGFAIECRIPSDAGLADGVILDGERTERTAGQVIVELNLTSLGAACFRAVHSTRSNLISSVSL
jgi:hypothetical protein